MCFMDNKTKSFDIAASKRFASTIERSDDIDVYYNDTLQEATVKYKKEYSYHKKHICGQITAYQRLMLLDQLMKMDVDKVVRVCTDGIYYYDHQFELEPTFREKGGMTFRNAPATEYLTSLMGENNEHLNNNFNFGEKREFYMRECHIGPGGTGKTEAILKDAGNAVLGIGRSTGEQRAPNAAQAAISSPLLEANMDGAEGVLITIAGSEDLKLQEVNEAARVITERADDNAEIICFLGCQVGSFPDAFRAIRSHLRRTSIKFVNLSI